MDFDRKELQHNSRQSAHSVSQVRQATSDDNDVFWEQLDRAIIDTYGFSELGRDYTDRGKAIR